MRCVAYGEGSVYVDLGIDDAPDRPARTRAVAAALARRFPAADVVVGAGVVAVHGVEPSYELREAARLASAEGEDRAPPRPLRRIEVIYDGPDLEPTARALGLAPGELRELHASRDYVAEVLGFLPGFAYLGPLDPRIVVPRRASPRAVVPACSIGIAAGYTGIYPFASPGGWSLIGRAVGVVPFDPGREAPSLLQPGDRVRFVPVDAGEVEVPAAEPAPATGTPALRVVQAAPGATIQDEGRAGWLGRGIPPSGPTLPELHAAANVAVGNAVGAAAIEVPLGSLEVVAEGEVLVSIDGEPARRLGDGERLRIEPAPCAVRYLAVRGGIDVPLVLGARATLLVARFGGLGGRALRAGDRVPVGAAAAVDSIPSASRAAAHEPEAVARLDIDPGPHLERFPAGAMEVLLAGSFRVSRLGDRVGVRLDGDRIPREGADVALPVPMRRGAVQVSTDGGPIVLGPDHPVTGGYPVIAVLRREAQAALARARPGSPVRFALA